MAFEKIKKSKLKSEIERRLVEGISPRKIAAWAISQGESISYLLIHQYRQKEFNVIKAAIEEMEPDHSCSIFEDGKRSVMADIQFLNRVIGAAEDKMEKYIKEPGMLSNFKVLADAAFRAIELKQKIRGEADGGTTINVTQINIRQLEEDFVRELARAKELEQLEAAQ